MDMGSNIMYKPVGVIGIGSFGTSVSNLLSKNSDVILYGRNPKQVERTISSGVSSDQVLEKNIEVTNDLEHLATKCDIIFPVIPSSAFRLLMKELSEFLRPYHILIHGTKGFDLKTEGLTLIQRKFYYHVVRFEL